jgi:RNA polymerase sigma-70 factor (ECF subfamily)
MNLESDALASMMAEEAPSEFEGIFRLHYQRVTRVITRVIGDRGRAEELAVEVFFKLWRMPRARGDRVGGWLYRTAVRKGLDELRRRTRRSHYESLLMGSRTPPTPEQVRLAAERQEKVCRVLALISRREAELLVLHSHGLSYEELAAALKLNPASVGALLGRARVAFRKEYLKRHGEE